MSTGPTHDDGRLDHDAIVALLKTVVNDSLDQKLSRINTDLAEINRALTGNGMGINKGVVGIVKDLEECDQKMIERVAALESKWDRLKWTVIGAGIGAGAAAGGTVSLVTALIGG